MITKFKQREIFEQHVLLIIGILTLLAIFQMFLIFGGTITGLTIFDGGEIVQNDTQELSEESNDNLGSISNNGTEIVVDSTNPELNNTLDLTNTVTTIVGGGGSGGSGGGSDPIIPGVDPENETQNSSIFLISPWDMSGYDGSLIFFTFNVSNESNFSSCHLIINDEVNGTISNVTNDMSNRSEFEFNVTNLSVGGYVWRVDCINNLSNESNITQSINRSFSVIPVSNFGGKTTNLNFVDISNITDLTLEDPSFGLIRYTEEINLSRGVDIDQFVRIEDNLISVDSENIPELNRPAILTFYNLSIEHPVILRNGVPCTNCDVIRDDANGTVTFSVSSFSNYSATENSQLNISDDTDFNRSVTTNVTFYANFSNTTSSNPILGATCTIYFDDGSAAMTYNTSSLLYEYNRSGSTGVFSYNVSCSATGYTTINLSDSYSIDGGRGVNGANVTEISTSKAPTASPDSHSAFAGNVSEITLYGDSITQSWQGYYGNVTGSIHLANANGDVLYNWSSASYTGEVYSTRHFDINFGTIGCATAGEISNEESAMSQSASDVDSISNTFSTTTHPAFFVGDVSISTNSCSSTNIFGSSGAQSSDFFEVLLADSGGKIVYTSLLEEDAVGFDSLTHDFEMIVAEDGHNGNTASTTYYFFLELG